LKSRRLGKTELIVSEIGLGCWQLGGSTSINDIPITYGDVNFNTAKELISNALRLGITAFDTADVYSLGESEKRLGEFLRGRRNDVKIFTKAGGVASYGSHPFELDFSYHHLIASLNRSLRRLQTDYVDLFQVHKPPQNEDDLSNIEKAFKKIKAEGLARYCGASIGMELEKGKILIERGLVDSIQLYFSMIDFQPIKELFPLAKKEGIGIIAAEPLSQGLLTAKYKPGHKFPKNDVRSGPDKKELARRIIMSDELSFLVNNSRTMSEAALAYVLSWNQVSICIPGAKFVKQLRQNANSSKISLTAKELKKIQEIQNNWS